MKNEPLKGKKEYHYMECSGCNGNKNDIIEIDYFKPKDVRSAVEWFQDWDMMLCIKPIFQYCDKCETSNKVIFRWRKSEDKERVLCIDCLINEAFADVMKEKEENE